MKTKGLTDMATIEERVAMGAAMLDAEEPGWEAEINLDDLDMASWHNCVGGQLDGWYYTFALRFSLADRPEQWGFNGTHPDEYPLLTAAWRDLIAARRLARMPPERELVEVA